jgi:hypothetical protein
VKHNDASATAHEIGEKRRLFGSKVVIACDQQNLMALNRHVIRLCRHVDVEVLRALQRPQQRARHLQVVVCAAGKQRQHRHTAT